MDALNNVTWQSLHRGGGGVCVRWC